MKVCKSLYVFGVFFTALLLTAVNGYSQTCPAQVRLAEDSSDHPTIQSAYDYASLSWTNFTLLLVAETFNEDLIIDSGSVLLDGGYDCSFSIKNLPTKILGSITISAGAATFDNIGLVSPPVCAFDSDGDGYTSIGSCSGSADDCDDNNPDTFPGAPEICDGADNNCDGQIDEGLSAVDADGDGYSAIGSCGGTSDDCNDNNSSIHPGAFDIPGNGIDEDCSGQDLNFSGELAECSACHPMWSPSIYSGHSNFPTPNTTCSGCHPVQVSNIIVGHYGRTVRTIYDNNMAPGSVIDCFSCHDYHDPNEYDIGGAEIVWPKVWINTPLNCDTCHETRAARHATVTAHDNRIIDPSCGACHTSNITTMGSPGSGTLVSDIDVDTLHRFDCILCHNYTGTMIDAGTVRQAIQDGLNGISVSCLDCHTDKGTGHGNVDHVDLGYVILGATSCANCHDPGGAANATVDITHNGHCIFCHSIVPYLQPDIPPGGGECTVCHTDTWEATHSTNTPDHSSFVANLASCTTSCHETTGGNTQIAVDGTPGNEVHDACTSCHTLTGALDTSKNGTGIVLGTMASGNCGQCHGTYFDNHTHHGTASNDVSYNAAFDTSQSSVTGCAVCHDDSGGAQAAWNDTYVEHKSACANCHSYDGSKSAPLLAVQGAIASGNPATCATCHTDKVPDVDHGAPTSGKHAEHLALSGVSCGTCHGTIPYFKSGTDSNGDGFYNLSETDVCDACHQDGTGNPATGIKSGWGDPGFTLDCSSCHAVTPSTGSHDTHLALTGCSSCHDSAVEGTTAPTQHLDGNIDVYDAVPGDLGYPVDKTIASQYSTCASTYCHNIGAPEWGGTVACGDCHAVNGTLAGQHAVHYDSSNNAANLLAANNSTADRYIFTCGVCHDTNHPDYMGHATGPVNANPATNQTAEVYFDTVVAGGPVGGIGWVTGNTYGSDPVGFPWTDQECGNMYCHSPGTKNAAPYTGPQATPNWVSGFSGECWECHDGDALAQSTMASGSHSQHIIGNDAYPSVRNKLDCSSCHEATVSDSRTIQDKSMHVNRVVNIAFDSTADPAATGSYAGEPAGPVNKAPGLAYGACANTYCHSQGTSVTAPYPAPNYPGVLTWGMDTSNFGHPDNPTQHCSACHGAYDDVLFGGIATNAHQAHVGDAAFDKIGDTIGCSNCHRATTGGGMQLNTPENHTDGFVEIKFEKDLLDYRGINFDTDGPAGTGPTYAGQNTAGDDLLTNFAQVVPDTSTKYVCSNLYCHSNGNLAANVNNVDPVNHWGEGDLADPATAFKTIEWNDTTHISCDGCHGDGAGRAHPIYANGGVGTTTANSHEAHVVGAGLNCTYCHFETLSDTNIPPVGGIISEHHVDRLEDVFIKPLAGTIPDAYEAERLKGCTAVYCHSNGAAVASGYVSQTPSIIDWGGASMDCNSCHNTTDAANNLGPDYPSGTPKANSHAAHQGLGCNACHYNTTSDGSTITNVATHVNGIYDIEAGNGIAFNYAFDSNGSTCTNISCHGGGDGVWGQSAVHTIEVGPGDLSNGTSCGVCHVVANWTEIEGTEHNVATNGAGSCATCHNSPRQEVIDAITAGADPTNCLDCHSDKTAAHGSIDHVAAGKVTLRVSPCGDCHDPGGAANATVDVTHSGDCSLCHTTVPDLQPGVPAGGGDCATCHGSDVQTVHPSCTFCHGEPPDGSTSPNTEAAHNDHAVLGYGSVSPSCNACHNGATHYNGTTNVSIPSSFNAQSGSATYSSSNNTCSSNRCHGGQTTPNWSTGSINVNTQCTSCHDQRNRGTIPNQYNDYYSGEHDKHVRSEGFACTECHSTSKLATGHFSNLQTTTLELAPGATIGGSDTTIGSRWNDSSNTCNNLSCHGKNHDSNDNW